MFGFLFGWRNASKCKKLVKQVQCRLKLLKNKSYTIARQLREDVGQLIKIGDEERALNRAEQLYKDENIMAVYELLDHFCEFIIIHLSYIRKHRELPNDINEAVSSLVYASARCGDLPELCIIRKLFSERYGQRFVATAVELLPGNLVKHEIKEKLSVISDSVPDDVKYRLVDEIARDCSLPPGILALEYTSEYHKEARESSNREQVPGTAIEMSYRSSEQFKDEDLKSNVMEMKALDAEVYSVSSSIIRPSSSDVLESPKNNAEEKQGNFSQMDLDNKTEGYKFTVTDSAIKENQETERVYLTCAGSKPGRARFKEEAMVYLDDIEELESSVAKDQRVFKFKSSIHPRRENSEYNLDEPVSEKSGSRTLTMSRKRSRRRSSASWENLVMNDIESVIYYNKPYRNSPSHKLKSHQQRKYQKKSHMKQPHDPVKSCYIVYNVFTYPDKYWPNPNDGSKEIEEKMKGCDSPGRCASSSNKSNRRSKVMAVPPYLRAKTMPTQERDKEICKEGFARSSSCTFRNPNHVHPKLPEYDEIAAKFMALRKKHIQGKADQRN